MQKSAAKRGALLFPLAASASRTKGLVEDFDLAVSSVLDGSKTWRGLWSEIRGSENHLDDLKAWYQQRRAEGWEPQKREIELLDYGKSVWNARQLETVYIRSTIALKNRAVGEYRSHCWIYTYLVDDEFKVYREQSSISGFECHSARQPARPGSAQLTHIQLGQR